MNTNDESLTAVFHRRQVRCSLSYGMLKFDIDFDGDMCVEFGGTYISYLSKRAQMDLLQMIASNLNVNVCWPARDSRRRCRVKLYKVLSSSRESVHGGSYRYPGSGRWTRYVEVDPCKSGYHLARAQDLPVWLDAGCVVWEAEGEGDGVFASDKVVFPRVRLVRLVGMLSDSVLMLWAADCAERVVHLTGPDQRCLDAIEAARRYARGEIGVDELDAARAASAAAARDASNDAARDAARAAARAASNASNGAANDAAWAAAWAARAARAASKAARDAARAAAWAASNDAKNSERKWQGNRLLEILEAEGGGV